MSRSDNEVFIFTWTIANFSMCPQKLGEQLLSPTFSVSTLKNTNWKLRLYPKGAKNKNQISCFLHYCNTGQYSGPIEISYKIAAVSTKTGTFIDYCQVKPKNFSSQEALAFDNIISRNEVCARKDEFLPNDVFTLKCYMWSSDDIVTSSETSAERDCLSQDLFQAVLCKEIFNSSTGKDILFLREPVRLKGCSARTVINVRRRNLYWPIKNLSSLRINQLLSIPIISPIVSVPSFHLIFCLSYSQDGEKYAKIGIKRQETDCSGQTFVMCKVLVLSTSKNDQNYTENEHLFAPKITDDVWTFPICIKSSRDREGEKFLDSDSDILYLKCVFAFSQLGDMYHTEDVILSAHVDQSVPFSNILNPSQSQLKNCYKDGEFSDVTLRAGDQVFNVHKIILSARSSVFRAMFSHEMKEKETGVVEITDLSPDTVDRMLAFLYTDVLEDLTPNDAVELYSAADKYEILGLKLRCSYILQSTLSSSNIYDVLKLTVLHLDEDLRDAVCRFISSNSRMIFQSSEWKDLMKSNLAIASDIMHRILSNNID